jgi:hypothetical protein
MLGMQPLRGLEAGKLLVGLRGVVAIHLQLDGIYICLNPRSHFASNSSSVNRRGRGVGMSFLSATALGSFQAGFDQPPHSLRSGHTAGFSPRIDRLDQRRREAYPNKRVFARSRTPSSFG